MTRPKAPPSVGAAGRRLWRAVTAEFELSDTELAVLELGCQAADDAAAARAVLAESGVVAEGRYGQPIMHPAVGVARAAEASVSRLLASLNAVDPMEKPARTIHTPGPKPAHRTG